LEFRRYVIRIWLRQGDRQDDLDVFGLVFQGSRKVRFHKRRRSHTNRSVAKITPCREAQRTQKKILRSIYSGVLN
jgi:hypothetical protein